MSLEMVLSLTFFLQCRGLKPGSPTCETGALQLSYTPSPLRSFHYETWFWSYSAHFYVESISFLKELLPRVPFCNFSEHRFELSRSVIKTWWLSPCGFLVLFSSPTFVPLLSLCRPVLNCLFVFTAAPSRWGVQAPSAPPWVPGTYPGADIPGSICWDFLWSEVSSPPSFPVSFLMAADFPRPCGPGSNPLALWHPQG